MFSFLLTRFGQYAFTLLVAISLNFLLPRFMPGSPIAMLAGEEASALTPEQRQQLVARTGLDQPLVVQYTRYLGNLVRGDFGYSFQKNKPVATLLSERLGWTLLLTGTGLVLSTLIGVTLGAMAAWLRGSRRDAGLLGTFIFLESLPAFWVGMVLVAVFAAQLRIFPTFGAETSWANYTGWERVRDIARHLVLPAATLTIVNISGMFLIARYSVLSVLGEEFITAARAKGATSPQVLFRHVLRNALLPIATVFTLNLAFAVGGATVIETVFSYPGVGRMIYEAVLSRDYPVLQGGFLLITIVVVFANLLSEAVYPLLDPRVRQARSGAPATRAA